MLILLIACAATDKLPSPGPADSAAEGSPFDTAIEQVLGSDAADPVYDPSVLHQVEITLAEADWDALRLQTRSIYDMLIGDCMAAPWDSPFTWFTAEVTMDGASMGTVGVRKKGLIGSDSWSRPSLRIDVDHVTEGARFYGLDKLVLNNNNQDWSRMRTCLAHRFYDEAGLVAPRCSLARVVVNGEDLGIYDNTEAIDEDLVERVLGAPPTTLYEGRLSDFREGWLGTFEAKNEESDGADLAAVVAALEQDDAALEAALDEVLNLDTFFTFWAAESFSGHWDSYNGNTNNFYVYGDPADGRLRFIASGPDASFDSREPFGSGAPVWVATASALSNRLIQIPDMKDRYETELRRLLDEVWQEDLALARIDAWEALISDELSREERRAISSLAEIVAAKDEDLEEHLGGRVTLSALAESACLTEAGNVTVEFSTTFGTYPDGDLFSGGEASTTYVIGDATYTSRQDGVSVGWYEEGSAIFLVISEIDDETWLAPYFMLDASSLVDGAVLTPGEETGVAYLLYNAPDTGGEWAVAAYLGLGSLVFEEAGTEDGAMVRGSLETSVLSGE